MVIVLPNEREGLTSLEPNVEALLAPQPYTVERVRIQLPKFTTETEIKFVPILQNVSKNSFLDAPKVCDLPWYF